VFPEELDVTVTYPFLSSGSRTDYDASPLALAVHLALTHLKIPFTHLQVTENRIYVYLGLLRRGHDACYYVSDDAWKLVARHREGRRVKPSVFTLEAIYIRKEQQ